MLTRSLRFDEAVKHSHVMTSTVDLYVEGALYAENLNVIEGNVRVRNEHIHRSCDVTILDPDGDLTPLAITDPLAPIGNEIVIKRGIQYPEGDSEMLQLGVFSIADIKIDDSGGGYQLRIEGYDRSRKISKARLAAPYVIASGTQVQTAIQNLLTFVAPWIGTIHTHDILPYTFPQIVLEAQKDPWEAARKMAQDSGLDLFFDELGQAHLHPQHPSTGDPDWTYAPGDDSMLLYVSKRWHDEGVYNHVIVTGEHSELAAPVRGEAMDTNPLSPTYVYGPFGDVTYFYTSPLITTVDQAEATAQHLLTQHVGFPEEINIQTTVHPAHDVGDTLHITGLRSKVDALYHLDGFTIPLIAGRGAAITCRERILTNA